MQIDTAGTYILKYTAEDSCGNVTEVTREVIAELPPTYRTVLYTDGTFIINESSRDQASNEALHGVATNVYNPFDPNGANNLAKYIFRSASARPWDGQRLQILHVEFGEIIQPTDMTYWFNGFTNATSISFANLDTSLVTKMGNLFQGMTYIASLDLSSFDTSKVTEMNSMFASCAALASVNLSSFDTSKVNTMAGMFSDCGSLQSLDLTNFNTSSVTNMASMFSNIRVTSLDLSSFDTSLVTNMSNMFKQSYTLTSIIVSSNFVVTQVTSSNNMFANLQPYLIGGAGTTWASANPTDKTYAHIDGGTSNPGYFTAKA